MNAIWRFLRRNALPLLVLVGAWILYVPVAATGDLLLIRAAQIGLVILAGLVIALAFPPRMPARLLGGAIGGIVGAAMVGIAMFAPCLFAAGVASCASMEWLYMFLVMSPLAAVGGLICGAIVAVADRGRTAVSP